jgi:hypothetical protein
MAITITLPSDSQHPVIGRFCVAWPQKLVFQVNFGESVVGDWVNVNFFLFGDQVEIAQPFGIPGGTLPPTGYNVFCPGVTSFQTLNLASASSQKHTWQNVRVRWRFPTISTGQCELEFIHTMDLKSWLNQFAISLPNFKRLFYSRDTDANEYDQDPDSIYNEWAGDSKYIGISVERWGTGLLPGLFVQKEKQVNSFVRYWKWWWNPNNDTPAEHPFSPTRFYYWQFFRNNLPVVSLSTAEDTVCKFWIELHDPSPATFDKEYHVGLVRVDPVAPNDTVWWLDKPFSMGVVEGTNDFKEVGNWFPKQLNGTDIVGDCEEFTNIGNVPGYAGEIVEAEFTIPKEVVEVGSVYRVIVIVKWLIDTP